MSTLPELAFAPAGGGCACAPCSTTAPGVSPRRRLRPPCARRSRTPSACAAPPGKEQKPPRKQSAEYHANVGSVIDSLRSDYPLLPTVEPPLSSYAENLTLRARAGLLCQGLPAYRGVLWLLRAQLRVCFGPRVHVAVHGLFHDAGAGQVFVRFRLSATPRVGMGVVGLGGGASAGSFVYDGLSVYTLNEAGLIEDHLLESIVRLRRPLRPLFESVLSASPVAAGAGAGRARVPTWCAIRRGELVPIPESLQKDDAAAEEAARVAAEGGKEAEAGLGVIGALAVTLAPAPVANP